MKLKVSHIYAATLALTNIINRQCPMPQRGKYLLARMHMKLMPEFKVIDAKRDEAIKAYNFADPDRPGEWKVPDDQMPAFTEAQEAIGNEEVDVDVQPIPLLALCMPNGTEGLIEASEFITLGDLVMDNMN